MPNTPQKPLDSFDLALAIQRSQKTVTVQVEVNGSLYLVTYPRASKGSLIIHTSPIPQDIVDTVKETPHVK